MKVVAGLSQKRLVHLVGGHEERLTGRYGQLRGARVGYSSSLGLHDESSYNYRRTTMPLYKMHKRNYGRKIRGVSGQVSIASAGLITELGFALSV